MIERMHRDRVIGFGGDDKAVDDFIENDYRIRSGMCPNGHGLLDATEQGQECSSCGYWTNIRAELTKQ